MFVVRKLIALGAAVMLVACDVGADDRWTRLRDALARTPADAQALALAAAIERMPDRSPVALGSARDGLAAIRALDRARARAGLDAWVGGQLDVSDGARACSPLLTLDGTLGSLDAWLATCPSPPTNPPERVTVEGLPALAAWAPSEGRVYLHPCSPPRSP